MYRGFFERSEWTILDWFWSSFFAFILWLSK
jgi:hypothetical protein